MIIYIDNWVRDLVWLWCVVCMLIISSNILMLILSTSINDICLPNALQSTNTPPTSTIQSLFQSRSFYFSHAILVSIEAKCKFLMKIWIIYFDRPLLCDGWLLAKRNKGKWKWILIWFDLNCVTPCSHTHLSKAIWLYSFNRGNKSVIIWNYLLEGTRN